MKKVTFFAAAAAVTALVASPAMAQDSMKPRAEKQISSKHMNKHMKKHHASRHMMRSQARAQRTDELASSNDWSNRGSWNNRTSWNNDRDNWNNRDSGFWPADVVGGAIGTAGAIAGTAVGTAGAIATAPFGGPSYNRGPYYSDASGYPYGNRHRYGDSFASSNYGGGWNEPGYSGEYSYNGIAMNGSPNYDARNGFTCRPGTVTRLANGQRLFCQ